MFNEYFSIQTMAAIYVSNLLYYRFRFTACCADNLTISFIFVFWGDKKGDNLNFFLLM